MGVPRPGCMRMIILYEYSSTVTISCQQKLMWVYRTKLLVIRWQAMNRYLVLIALVAMPLAAAASDIRNRPNAASMFEVVTQSMFSAIRFGSSAANISCGPPTTLWMKCSRRRVGRTGSSSATLRFALTQRPTHCVWITIAT